MRPDWRLDQAERVSDVSLRIEHVLVELNGPQVVFAKDDRAERYIGVAADDNDDFTVVRWVYAPISHLAFTALACGGAAVREAMLDADAVFVVDELVDGALTKGTWKLSPSDLPPSMLPKVDSVLPEETIASFASLQSNNPSVRIG